VNYNGQPLGPLQNLAVCWKLRVSGGTRPFEGSENPSGADNQQETTEEVGSSETAREARGSVKIQSDPHGDMRSQAEMIWPRRSAATD
jgi:hypothetical protein